MEIVLGIFRIQHNFTEFNCCGKRKVSLVNFIICLLTTSYWVNPRVDVRKIKNGG